MYSYSLHQSINKALGPDIDMAGKGHAFYSRFMANAWAIQSLYNSLYEQHPKGKQAF
jgi:hypothetical protein